ncbi:phage/plasmid primase, P4 family [Methanolobus vulcani]|uniref:SF3 helicase domain-containing protein n=1 Tax=Methanolobus vulcani TaxID=38026 RepID=A0A7Z8P325_9EURY|nr:phage/plasmid primase, P4 family [Methanolobus vulcani]TQD28274.1 hypothetical protein FKV42_00965 [Methanolobus vulcani]
MSPACNRDVIEDIKSKIDIVDLVGETVQLKQKGASYRGATSTSSKSGASLIVDPQLQMYKNFAEDDGGDIFNWISYREGLDIDSDFPKILEIAAEKAGVVLEHQSQEDLTEKGLILSFLRAAAGYYHSQLTDECRDYIHNTWGISDKMIDELQIGWAPGNSRLQREMADLFPSDVMEMSGLFHVSGNRKLRDVFRGCIIFPYWKGGKVVYFIGRDPKWNKDSTGPKYFKQLVHSEQRPHISKVIDNSVFYGEDSIKRADSVIITEGVTDCIKVLQEGLPCISPVTVRIKEEQKEYAYDLIKTKSEVIICNDNEDNETGKNGAIATAEYLEHKGVQVSLIELPRPNDVDKIDLAEYLQENTKEDFLQLESNNVWEIKLNSQNVPEGNVEKARTVKRFILNDLKLMDSSIRDIFIRNDVRKYFDLSKTDMNTILKSVRFNDDEITQEDDQDFFTVRGKLRVKKLGEYVMSLARYITFDDTKSIYVYRNGVYVPRGEDTIARIVQTSLGDASKKHHISEIINYVQLETLTPRSKINHDINKINILNGLYNLNTGQLDPHSPDYISIVQLPITYDPDATCPAVDKFISEVLEEKYQSVIYEILGYCMIPDTRIEKSVMFLGKGANGKSVMLNMFGEFLGSHNVAAESLHMLEKDPYSLAELYGKLANIFPDLASGALYENSTFKMLTGNEKELRAQRKYEHPFKFRNTARLVFSANELPPVPGHDFAYFRRWILLKFPYTFEGKKADKGLIDKLTTPEELSGLFNRCVVALRALLARGEYSYDMTTDEVMKMYKVNSDPIAAFADEVVVFAEKHTPKKAMFSEYVEWCKSNGIDPAAENIFAKRFKKLGYVPGREPTGDRPYVWENCTIKGQSVWVKENNPDGKNQEQDVSPSNCLGLSSNCNVVQNVNKKDSENNYTYINNREITQEPRRIECEQSLLQSNTSCPGSRRGSDISFSLGEKMNLFRQISKHSNNLQELVANSRAAGIEDPWEIMDKMESSGEFVRISQTEFKMVS